MWREIWRRQLRGRRESVKFSLDGMNSRKLWDWKLWRWQIPLDIKTELAAFVRIYNYFSWNPMFLYKISLFTISQSSIMHSSDVSAYFPRLPNKSAITEFELSLVSTQTRQWTPPSRANSTNISTPYISCKISINIILTITRKVLQILSPVKLLRLNVAASMVVPPVSPFQI